MSKDPAHKQSSLEAFKLSFEYDVTWQEAKQAIKDRTHTK
jgi:hypothetical protein